MRLPDFSAADATRRFNSDLYQEHLEEASFLYEQRQGLYEDVEVSWLAVADFEERLEAHLDALVLGDGLSLEICQRRAEEGEPGELYAAVCVFCRQGRRDLLGGVLKSLDADDAVKSRATADAMKHEMPEEWAHALIPGLTRGFDKLIPMLAEYVGHHRVAPRGAFDTLIDRVPAKGLPQLIWGLGRVGGNGIAQHLAGYVSHEDATVRTNAVLASLRQGEPRALAACRQRALRGDPAMVLPLAVSGSRSDAASLRNLALAPAVTPEVLIALGVLGDLGSVQLLVEKLADEAVGAAAATALHLITGAGLQEDAFVPEAVHEDELFEEELQLYRETGEAPQHADGRPFGVSIDRTSQNPEDWRRWLAENKAQFDPTLRYRLGKPFSPATLVDTLVSGASGRQVRSMAADELAIRYGIDVAFEPEMRVDEQKRQINAIARLCREREASFHAGQWYFVGQ